MSKITVTTIAGQTSGSDANKVKIDPSNTLHVPGHAAVGADVVDATRALTVVGASDGTGSSIIVGYNSSLAAKFSVRDDGLTTITNNATIGGTLDVTGNTTVGGNVISNDGSNVARFQFDNDNQVLIQNDTAMNFYVNGGNYLKIDSSGNRTLSNNASFLARCDSYPAMDIATIPFGAVVHNTGGHYNNSNYRFTAPVTGRYLLTYSIRANHGTSGHIIHPSFEINGTSDSASRTIYKNDTSAQYMATTFSYVRQLSANDYVTVSMTGGSSGGTLQGGQVTFSGNLLG